MTIGDRPESVEEAGAMLGAAITLCGTGATTVHAPPKGMHSSFGTVSVPSSDLLVRLYYLRALLRASPPKEPLVAAPSLLAVLMKLLSTSTQLAAKNAADASSSRGVEIPPMISTPLRRLWVECVVLCHRLGEGLSGNARTSLFSFLKNMIALAGMNPRSAKAGGGARIAALDVIAGLFEDETLASKVSGWAHDALQLCLRALRSSGNGEPSFRISAMKMGCAVAKACRMAQLKLKPIEGMSPQRGLLLPGAMEGPAVLEAIKVLKQATNDKYPEVRSACATFAALMAPMLVLPPKLRPNQGNSNQEPPSAPVVNLDEVIGIALRNVDDESPEVAVGWSEALARCLCTAIEVGQRKAESAMAKRDVEADQDDPQPGAPSGSTNTGRKKKETAVALCKNHRSAILFLIRIFVKAGGQLSATRAGGSFSMGGRSVRIGLANALVHLLRIQSTFGGIGDESGISMSDCVRLVLKMAGEEASKQFAPSPSTQTLDVTTPITPEIKPGGPGNALFGSKKSGGDAGLVRLATCNVVRFGLSELASENAQLSLLQDLIGLLNPAAVTDPNELKCNGHQLQVILVEISHLLSALGEAAASKVEDLVTNLKSCLNHPAQGVRHEAAIACGALANSFPATGREMLEYGMKEIRSQHSELMGVANRGESVEVNDPKRSFGRMFRRAKKESEKKVVDPTLVHQYAIHGISLMMAIVARELPQASGGIARQQLSDVLSVAEELVGCQFNEVVTKANPAIACTCIRSGFGIIAGLLATGPVAIQPHTKKIFELFEKSYKSSAKDGNNFSNDHDLGCVEVVLTAIVAFLSYDSELLLSVPEALSQITIMLEELLVLFSSGGRFAGECTNPAALIRLKSAKASLMEAFAWLPSGSFPMAADAVFSFAGQQIKVAIAGEVTCSILPSLVSKEDVLLDAKSVSRVYLAGQVGGAKEIEESVVILTSETADHGERESVLHFPGSHVVQPWEKEFRKSQILGMFAYDAAQPPPTPLHAAVGTWRKPVEVSCSSTVRLLDAAIQAYAATFGLKGGMEQQEAMEMLEKLVPPFLTQLASAIGMNTTLSEPASRTKAKEDNAAVANITAILLSCLKALPLHEATHNVPIGLGPPWMNKAKDLLLTLLPCASNVVRRAAAEGLALLATLGVSEDAHFLQSAVLHSLDEVMQGNQPDGKPRTLPLEPVSASRAGSLLTLACIQRMAQKVNDKKLGRNKGRALSAEEIILQGEETLPTLQMMTRILPSVARQGFRDFFIVQTHALHAFGLLLGYSSKLEREKGKLEPEDLQLLRKGCELVEDNFVASWTIASADFDAGQEAEKLAAEASFLAVLLRLMALLVPSLHQIHSESPGIANRFSAMATIILEAMGSHPVVAVEGMAFFEVLAGSQSILPPPSRTLLDSDNPLTSCVPFFSSSLKPRYPGLYAIPSWLDMGGCLPSTRGMRAVLRAIKVMALSGVWEENDVSFIKTIFAFLEGTCASRCYPNATLHRPLAAPRASELVAVESLAVEKEAAGVLRALVSVKRSSGLLHMILFTRTLVAGASAGSGEREPEDIDTTTVQGVIRQADLTAANHARYVLDHVGQIRWQLKSLSIVLSTAALKEMSLRSSTANADSPDFCHGRATDELKAALATASSNPTSRLVFHLSGIVSLACTSAVAAVDQAELPTLQLAAVLLLAKLVACFRGVQDPQEPDAAILDQYTTQILSSVKHSLGDPESIKDEASYRLFYGGCEAIQTIVESQMTQDQMAIKRIIRPTIPAGEDTPFFEYGSSFPKEAQGNYSTNLMLIGKVWTAGILLSERSQSAINIAAAKKLVEDELGLAVYAAAIAFDGARLLAGEGATLCGAASDEGKEENPSNHAQTGYLINNIHDIEDSAKAALVTTWSACGCFALRTLAKKAEEETDDKKKVACRTWVKKLAPLMFEGLYDCLSEFENSKTRKTAGWCGGIESSDVAVNCLYGLRVFVEGSTKDSFDVGIDVDQILNRLRDSVISPVLGCATSDTKGGFSLLPEGRQAAIIKEICDMINHVATANAASSSLLKSILTPLDLLQRGSIDFGQKHVDIIVSTCLSAAGTLISLSKTSDAFVKAMTQIALEVQLSEKGVPTGVNSAAKQLLKACLSHQSVEAKDRRVIAHELARLGDWETWCAVCAVDDGLTASGSMDVLKDVLLDTQNPEKQLQALAAIRVLVQPPRKLIGLVFGAVGGELLHFFKMYGASPAVSRAGQARRTTACADTMKIVLVAFQQLVADATTDQVFVPFLMVTFEYMLMVLRYNGLPNHPPPQAESDPALGRMTAQAVVHIARTAPLPFKGAMGSMSDADRAALEFAVRAEMTGYANATAQAQPKKKLSLKGFKK